MARKQLPKNIDLGSFSTTPVQLSLTSILCTSFIIQALEANTDFVMLGNSTGQYYEIAPGRDLAVHGDALDNGTYAYVDLADWYIVAASGNQTGNVLYLERY